MNGGSLLRRSRGCAVAGAGVLVAVILSAAPSPVAADVTAVKGSALGFSSSVSLFGGPARPQGPAPTVALPAGGSTTPITQTAASGSAVYGPANIFSSGELDVSTQGAPGPNGTVTTSSAVHAIVAFPFNADSATSTCTASQTGVSASTNVANGTLATSTDSSGNPLTTVPIPSNPPVNDTIHGTLNSVGDTFKWVFNEQITNPDGSITVNAAHEYLLGPTAVGDLFIGQSICGVTAVASTTTTSTSTASTSTTTTAGGTTTTSTTAGGTTTTTAGGGTTTTSTTAGGTTTSTTGGGTTTTTAGAATSTTAASTTTTTVVKVGASAYGYYSSVSFFGGAPLVKGPAPTVSLPAGGSDTPVTASAPSGSVVDGPAELFSSGALNLSVQGSPASGSVTASAHIASIGPGTFSATAAASTCTADASGARGSATITNGTMATATDADGNPTNPAAIPANPPVDFTLHGAITNVGDTYKFVFNEQVANADGSITVNAAHEYLLGPTAVGDVIIGQVRCARLVSTTTGAGGTAGSNNLAFTGGSVTGSIGLALALLLAGALAVAGRRRRQELEGDPSLW